MRLISFLIFTLFALPIGTPDYGGLWQEVDEHTRNGKPKSALEVVQKIHDQAINDGNSPQLVKAVIHEIKFQAQFEEESLVASIIRLEDEAKTVPEPTKQILHSLLAEMHWLSLACWLALSLSRSLSLSLSLCAGRGTQRGRET